MPTAPAPDVVVVGSLNMDIVVAVARHPLPGETIIGADAFRTPGGKGANQAVAAARLGRRVAMVGRVGEDDFGATLLAALNDYDVDPAAVVRTRETPTGIALVTVDANGENVIVVAPGANARVTPADVEAGAALIDQASVVLAQLEIPLDAVTEAAVRTRGTVILNPAPAPTAAERLPARLLQAVDVLVPNRGELGALAGGGAPDSIAAIAALAHSIEGPDAVVVTLAEEGALLAHAGAHVHLPASPVRAVDTTAAGDCFCGALADALARGESLETAVRWAVRAASLAVTRPGAQASMPTRAEVEAG